MADSLETARQKMRRAKDRFREAAVAVLRGDSDAGTLAQIALDQVQAAREELRRLNELDVNHE